MSVLVDTSVWIRFLQGHAEYAERLDALLDQQEVFGHDYVYGELLMGDSGGRHALLESYGQMQPAPVVQHAEVVTFARARNLAGRGIGWIDAHLLASALVGRLTLWTADQRLRDVACELDVAFRTGA